MTNQVPEGDPVLARRHFRGNIDVDKARELNPNLKKSEVFMDTVDIDRIPGLEEQEDWFVAMIGGIYDFYGMNLDAIKLNDIVYQFLPDPHDGYRSYLGAVILTTSDSGFFSTPVAKVCIADSSSKETWPPGWKPPMRDEYSEMDDQGYYFIDITDNHVWAFVGTHWADSYYPCFRTYYCPKPPPRV